MHEAWETLIMLAGYWWFWVAGAFGVIGLWYMAWRLLERREYKKINGKLCVRHGIGEWVDLEKHIKEKHPESTPRGKR